MKPAINNCFFSKIRLFKITLKNIRAACYYFAESLLDIMKFYLNRRDRSADFPCLLHVHRIQRKNRTRFCKPVSLNNFQAERPQSKINIFVKFCAATDDIFHPLSKTSLYWQKQTFKRVCLLLVFVFDRLVKNYKQHRPDKAGI